MQQTPLAIKRVAEEGEIEKTVSGTEHDFLSPRDEVITLQALRQHVCTPQPPLPVTERMPPEVWALVFEHSLSEDYGINCPDASQIMNFGLVCQRWRSVTLSSPQLWRHLPSFHRHDYESVLSQNREAHTKVFLERGGDTPISFHAEVFYVTMLLDIFASHLHPVLMLLVSQCRRWKHVILKMCLDSMKDLSQIRGELPLLHTLELEFSTRRLVVDIFKDAPSLRVVKLVNASHVTVELPWHQLEEFSETGCDARNLLNILRYSADLRSLLCSKHAFEKEDFAHLGQVVFNKLTSLQLKCFDNVYGLLLNHITLPALTELRVFSRGELVIDDVVDLVRRSGCNLLHLTYFNDELPPTSVKIRPLLLLAPSLEELEFNEFDDFPSEGLEYILQTDIVPRLRSLAIHIKPLFAKQALDDGPKRFNALAELRCSQNRTSGRESGRATLDVLRLHFDKPEYCLCFQQALQIPMTDLDIQRLPVGSGKVLRRKWTNEGDNCLLAEWGREGLESPGPESKSVQASEG